MHRPDLFAHPADVAETLLALRQEGKIRAIGVSNHTVEQRQGHSRLHLGEPLATSQPELSVLHLDPIHDGVLDHCMAVGTQPLAWSPLAGGRLATGAGVRPEVLQVLDELAAREDADRADVALAFVLAHPWRPIAVVGTERPERLATAARACSVALDRADLYRLVVASEGVPLP